MSDVENSGGTVVNAENDIKKDVLFSNRVANDNIDSLYSCSYSDLLNDRVIMKKKNIERNGIAWLLHV